MGVLLHYQIPKSKFVILIAGGTVLAVLCALGVIAIVKLYASRLRALEAEKRLAQFEAAEKTRQRIAEDLHASIGQSIAVAKALVADLLEQHPECAAALHSLYNQLNSGMEDLRQLSQALHGERLLETGILIAIRTDIELAERMNGYVINSSLPDEELPLSHETKLALYRMLQNAMANIYRHAQASLIDITLQTDEGGITLIVADNGVGFDPDQEQQHPSLGLDSIRQHAAQLGGQATILSAVGRGTTVTIHLPHTIADE
ncbi:sensor histidine kinase [Parapedobacter sp. 2B3]|uniref:sensor histidine kinase n=1 Tax=Parapedobacter sp. 2B3 TaxID=3342381 RepID=UPI0035B60521